MTAQIDSVDILLLVENFNQFESLAVFCRSPYQWPRGMGVVYLKVTQLWCIVSSTRTKFLPRFSCLESLYYMYSIYQNPYKYVVWCITRFVLCRNVHFPKYPVFMVPKIPCAKMTPCRKVLVSKHPQRQNVHVPVCLQGWNMHVPKCPCDVRVSCKNVRCQNGGKPIPPYLIK